MAAGALVPFCKILLTPGDTMEIDLTHQIMTHPTIGPLFGSYKVQADIFQCPIRLYNAMLHNNALNIGLKMSDVKLPKIEVEINERDTSYNEDAPKDRQISESSVLAYLGQRGYAGYVDAAFGNSLAIKRNAVPLLAYYDIFKNYYANKQEENAYVITGVDHIWKKIQIGDGYVWDKPWLTNSAETYTVTPTTEKPQYIKLEFEEKVSPEEVNEHIVTGKQIGRASCRERVLRLV